VADTDTSTETPPEGAPDPSSGNGNGTQEGASEPPTDDKTEDQSKGSEVDQATEKHLADLRKENASWRRKLREAEKRIEELTTSSADEIEKAKAEARQEAIAEATKDVNTRLLRAEVLAAATGKMAVPAHAFAILNDQGALDGLEPNEAGEFDRDKINEAIDNLVKSTPALGVTRDPDFGARPPTTPAPSTDELFTAFINEARR